MKKCPECETLYEDHVDDCLVDGSSLVEASPDGNTVSMARTGSFSQQLSNVAPGPSVDDSLGPFEPEEESRSSSRGPLILGVVVLLLGGVGAAAATMVVIGSQPPEAPPEPVVAVAMPPPPAPPPPQPKPEPEFALTTVPAGASVSENERLLCRTPCVIAHPAHAPLPREFVITHDGYEDQVYTVSKATGSHQVSLAAVMAAPPPPRPARRPRPSEATPPAPVAAAPKPTPAPTPAPRRTLGGGGDLKNPFNR